MEATPNFIGYGKMTWHYGDDHDEVGFFINDTLICNSGILLNQCGHQHLIVRSIVGSKSRVSIAFSAATSTLHHPHDQR